MTMPRQKDLKRLVRARMKKTGEAYTTARSQILKSRNQNPARELSPRCTLLGSRTTLRSPE
jgi:hypothetical protein